MMRSRAVMSSEDSLDRRFQLALLLMAAQATLTGVPFKATRKSYTREFKLKVVAFYRDPCNTLYVAEYSIADRSKSDYRELLLHGYQCDTVCQGSEFFHHPVHTLVESWDEGLQVTWRVTEWGGGNLIPTLHFTYLQKGSLTPRPYFTHPKWRESQPHFTYLTSLFPHSRRQSLTPRPCFTH